MKIGRKILASLIVLLLLLSAIILIATRSLILESYTRLELTYMREHVERVAATLDDRLKKLEYTIHDWASWTDTYEYLAGRRQSYITDNIMDSAFVSLNINLVAFVDTAGKMVFAKSVDIKTGAEIPLPTGFETLLAPGSALLATGDADPSRIGIILLSDRILMVAARPVLTSEGEGPFSGTILMARFLDETEMRNFAKIVRLPLGIYRLDEAGLPSDITEAFALLSSDNPISVKVMNGSSMYGHVLIRDFSGKPALIIRVEGGREIHAYGVRTIAWFIGDTLVLSLAIGVLLWILLQRIVLRRLVTLSADASRIQSHGNISERIAVGDENDELSDVIRAINAMLDALKHNQNYLRQAQRNEALAKLAGGTAHEFNNILAIMQGSLELAIDELPPDNTHRARLETAYRAGEKGRDIVGRILEFSRTSRQEQIKTSLSRAVLSALEMADSLFPPNITLTKRIAENTRPILANPLQIEQVVINLCKNSIDAIGDLSGKIEIFVEDADFSYPPPQFPDLHPGSWVRFIIKDSGGGILPSIQKHIFDPFFTTKKIGQGIGLGLSVVRGIVQQHRGWIGFESASGKGASFQLLFPALSDDYREGIPGGDPGATSGQVMFVDGDGAALALAMEGLEALGYGVTLVGDAASALKQLSEDPCVYNAVLVNKTLPDMDGLEFCGHLKKKRPEIAPILYLEEGLIVSSVEMDEAGVQAILRMPLTIRALAETIGEAVDGVER